MSLITGYRCDDGGVVAHREPTRIEPWRRWQHHHDISLLANGALFASLLRSRCSSRTAAHIQNSSIARYLSFTLPFCAAALTCRRALRLAP